MHILNCANSINTVARHENLSGVKKRMRTTPTNLWLPDEEIYLHSIQKSCEQLTKLYLKKYKQSKALQTKLKLPAIIIGSFTGVASFGTESFPGHSQKYVSIGVGIISICIAILNTIESFLKVGETTNSAINTALALQQLREDINKELCLPSPDRLDAGIIFLRDVYTRYVQILAQAPVLEDQENMAFVDTLISKKISKLIRSNEFYNGRSSSEFTSPVAGPLQVAPLQVAPTAETPLSQDIETGNIMSPLGNMVHPTLPPTVSVISS